MYRWMLMRLWAPATETGEAGGAGDPPPRRRENDGDDDDGFGPRLARERRKWENQFGVETGKLSDAAQELQRLRTQETERKRKEAEADRNYQAALQSKDEEWSKRVKDEADRASALKQELRKDRVRGAIIAAAAEHNAIKPEQIADLLEGRSVSLDDDTLAVIVLGNNGQPSFFGGKPMTVSQRVAAFLEENPHLAKASGTGGSGSRGGASTSEGGQQTNTGETQELRKAREEHKAAIEKAQATGQAQDVTAAQKASNRVRALEEALRQKKSA